jgi:hypothetical protein
LRKKGLDQLLVFLHSPVDWHTPFARQRTTSSGVTPKMGSTDARRARSMVALPSRASPPSSAPGELSLRVHHPAPNGTSEKRRSRMCALSRPVGRSGSPSLSRASADRAGMSGFTCAQNRVVRARFLCGKRKPRTCCRSSRLCSSDSLKIKWVNVLQCIVHHWLSDSSCARSISIN